LFAQLQPLFKQESRAQWLERFEKAGVPCAPVYTIPEALVHPQVRALEIFQQIPGETFGLTALPVIVDGERPGLRAAAPRLGEYNVEYGLKSSEGESNE